MVYIASVTQNESMQLLVAKESSKGKNFLYIYVYSIIKYGINLHQQD